MTSNEALQALVELVMTAQRRGALTLQEASTAWDAIKAFQADDSRSDDSMPPALLSTPDNKDVLVD